MKHCHTHNGLHLWLGLIFFIVGAVWLLESFGLIPNATWQYLWPLILIVTGLKLMFKGEEEHQVSHETSSKAANTAKKKSKKKKH